MKGHIITGVVLSMLMAGAFALSAGPSALASEALPEGFEAQPIINSGETRDGDPIVYPDTDRPVITAAVATLEPGGRTALHQHPVPVFVYVLEGAFELETEGGTPQVYKAGDAWIESLNRDHQVFNRTDEPAKFIAVFAGAEGVPNTVAA
jgi:quercetin dioxygenase-like cupin family protein